MFRLAHLYQKFNPFPGDVYEIIKMIERINRVERDVEKNNMDLEEEG